MWRGGGGGSGGIYLSYEMKAASFKVLQADKCLYDYHPLPAIDAMEYKWQHFEDVKSKANLTVPLKFRLEDQLSKWIDKIATSFVPVNVD